MTAKEGKKMADSIKDMLFSLRDEPYASFVCKLVPHLSPDLFIGVRTPALRKLAKTISGTEEAEAFLLELPHTYFEENQLHAFLISEMKSFDLCLAAVERFLPYINNWATCDQLSPSAFKKNPEALLPAVERWLESDLVYTIRFAIGVLMQHFLDSRFSSAYLRRVAAVQSEEYYVKMMQAWYFATALAKQWEETILLLESGELETWVHNKTIRKAVESFRIGQSQKDYLKTLRKREKK